MVGRLVVDAAWRNRQMYLVMLLLIALLWATVALGYTPISVGLMTSLMLAYVLGPVGAIATMGLRELRTLPVTSRDLWVATWANATVVITFALTATQNLAVIAMNAATGSSAVSTEALVLTAIYCFAYAGALSPIMPAMGYSLGRINSHRPKWLWVMLSIACFLVFIGGFGLPYYFAKFLPLALNQFSWGAASALVACLTLTVISLRWTPQRGGFVPAKVETSAGAVSQSKPSVSFADRLTGIPRIAWPFVTLMLMLSAGTLAAFVGYWAAFESGTSLRSFLQNNAVLLFDTGFLPSPDQGSMWSVFAVAAIATSSPWRPFGRQLKVLPLSTYQVNALLLATPFAQWALAWLALIATHVAVIGVLPSSVRPDVLMFLGGVSALGHGLMFRHGHMGSIWIVVLMGAAFSMAARLSTNRLSVPVEVVLIATGVIALAVAAFVNHRTLTRSTSASKVYRPESLPFGVSAPGAPR